MSSTTSDPAFSLAKNTSPTHLELLAGASEMAELIRSFDWSRTPLGPVEGWSQSLKMMVSFMLANRFPLLLWWGPEYISIYNDAYRPVLGAKHPWALGTPFRKCWAEIQHVLAPLIDQPFRGGPATWMDDIELEINRYDFLEETHFTIAYSPVPDETAPRGIGGVLATVHEITEKVIGERHMTLLRNLSARSAQAKTAEEACVVAAEVLAESPKDVPFALLYLLDPDGRSARLAAATGLGQVEPPRLVEIREQTGMRPESGDPWRLAEAVSSDSTVTIDDLAERVGAVPAGPWSDPPRCAMVVPLRSSTSRQSAGVLVAGASGRLRLNDQYRSLFELAGSQIAAAIANAHAYEAERKRAEALAEIDRAKTVFFSNVSHEFRTPLTLMLGPLEQAAAHHATPATVRTQLKLAHRNSLRLLKLVNSLLDFSRIEAGRVQATYESCDLAELTNDLASTFRSAMEQAGLTFSVECDDLGEPVYVDREMWEKIVLNLLSNAFKFTLRGGVAVRLRREAGDAMLEVSDTGVGVPEHEIPHLFKRFYRVESTAGRTQEGSGIGLALVQELVKFQGGSISAVSRLGSGSTFRVAVPFGSVHLPPERIVSRRALASTVAGAHVFVQEALRWISSDMTESSSRLEALAEEPPPNSRFVKVAGAHILLADDNADMRAYVRGLLSPTYVVETVADGEQALATARRQRPDLIVCDIMMPRLGGLGLLKILRTDESLRDVPVILLSARAGEEARVEGLDAGADDYLVKPFSAREFLARVGGLLELTRMRRENEESFHAFVSATSEVIYRMSPDWRELRQLHGRNFIADTVDPSLTWFDRYIHPDDQPRVMAAIEEAIRTKNTFQLEHRVRRVDGTLGWAYSRAIPVRDAKGNIVEWFGAASDVTERKETEQALREREEQLRLATEAAEVGLWDVDLTIDKLFWPPRVKAMFGVSPDVPVSMVDFYSGLHPVDRQRTSEAFAAALDPERRALYDIEYRTVGKEDGLIRWVAAKGRGIFDANGRCVRVLGTAIDITARKRAEEALSEADRRKDEFLAMLAHELRNPLAPIGNASEILSRLLVEDSRARVAAEMIKRQTAHLTRLVDDLLDVSRITQGRIQLDRRPLDIAGIITQAIETVEPQLRAKQHKLSVLANSYEPFYVNGDHARLVQCVANVVANAVKYTDPGGEIRIQSRAEGESVLVEISDTGVGIAAELLPRVFDLFVQSDRTLDRAQGGLGIGLAVVRRLVEMHEGQVAVRSPGLGCGSTFQLRLPRIARPPVPGTVAVPVKSPSRRVLIVDDNQDAANSLAVLLSLQGHQTRAAHSGKATLECLQSFKPEVILLDLGLPDMNGYVLAERLSSMPQSSGMRLIALTGYGQTEDRQRTQAAGFDDHLVKPVDLPTLERTLAGIAVGDSRRKRAERG
jgi:PAS domain S-box-containing protein